MPADCIAGERALADCGLDPRRGGRPCPALELEGERAFAVLGRGSPPAVAGRFGEASGGGAAAAAAVRMQLAEAARPSKLSLRFWRRSLAPAAA
jgi:hypothetical protein